MSSSDSEDDVMLQRIRESTAEQLHAAMKRENKEMSSSQSNKLQCTSSLNPVEPKTSSDKYELKITPEFRHHVAKKLCEHLDGLVQCITVTCDQPKQDETGGIRLLSSSISFATVNDIHHRASKRPRTPQSRKQRHSSSSSEDAQERFAAASISGESILNGGEGEFKRNRTGVEKLASAGRHGGKKKRR